jgi:hypothetical protein
MGILQIPPIVPASQDHALATAWKIVQTLIRQAAAAGGAMGQVKTFRLGEGGVDEFYPATEAELPWLRVIPIDSPVKIGSESEWEVDLNFSYEIAVAGTRIVDLMNLCGAFFSAFSQSTQTPLGNVQELYRAAGIRVVEITRAAIGPYVPRSTPGAEKPPPPFMKAQGIVHGQVFFNN